MAEGIDPADLVETVGRIVQEYKQKGYPDERFHKFFKRVGEVAGYHHEEYAAPLVIEPAACGE